MGGGGGGGGRACFWNPGGNRSRGVGLVCNVSLDFEDLEVRTDFHGRLINVKLSLHDWQFQIICIYGPNDRWPDRSSFQTYGDTRSPGYLCFWEVISIVLTAGDKGSVELKDFADFCLFLMSLGSNFQRENCLPDITSVTLICHRLIEFRPPKVCFLMLLGVLLIRVHILIMTWCL